MSRRLRLKENELFRVETAIDLAWTGPQNAPRLNAHWYAVIRRAGKRMRRITGRMPAGMRARGDKTGGRRKGQAVMGRPKHLWMRSPNADWFAKYRKS